MRFLLPLLKKVAQNINHIEYIFSITKYMLYLALCFAERFSNQRWLRLKVDYINRILRFSGSSTKHLERSQYNFVFLKCNPVKPS